MEHGNGTTQPQPTPRALAERPTAPLPAGAPMPTGTPDDDPYAALHWAAIATGLAEARAEQGNPLTDAEREVYDRFLAAAHRHGHTEQQIRDHLARLPRPSRITGPATVADCRADYAAGADIRRRFDQRIQDHR